MTQFNIYYILSIVVVLALITACPLWAALCAQSPSAEGNPVSLSCQHGGAAGEVQMASQMDFSTETLPKALGVSIPSRETSLSVLTAILKPLSLLNRSS